MTEEKKIVEISFVGREKFYEMVDPVSVLAAVKYNATILDKLLNGEEIIVETPYKTIYRLATEEDRIEAENQYQEELKASRAYAKNNGYI